jgi:hypothetical protein
VTAPCAAFTPTASTTPTLVQSSVDNTNRGEWVLTYDVDDTSGNSADSVTFAVIMQDKVKPTICCMLYSVDLVLVAVCFAPLLLLLLLLLRLLPLLHLLLVDHIHAGTDWLRQLADRRKVPKRKMRTKETKAKKRPRKQTKEVDEEKEAGADGGVLRASGADVADDEDEDEDEKDDEDVEIDEHDDECRCSADGRGGKPGAVT